MAAYYVSASDNFLSGWGEATGKVSKFVVACDTEDQVKQTKRWMERDTLQGRRVYSHIETHNEKPYFPPQGYHVSVKHYDECTAIHRA